MYGVLFCGTPHRGANAAAWGRLASNIVAAALQSPNDRILSGLEVDSEILDLIQEDFLRVLHDSKIRIHSFQEGRGLSGILGGKKVVDDFSSKLGHALETTQTIDANHMEIVALAGSQKISRVIKRYISDIEKSKAEELSA